MHRLFVCIAGVADQLQTNFASDLRQILRSVFLMNTTPTPEEDEIKIPEKTKDSPSDLFEFRASENDVIQENDGGSNQSIYSAEEANPETDSVFEQSFNANQTMPVSDRQERSSSLETEIRIRTNVERSRSLGEDSSSSHHHHHHRSQPVSVVVTTSNHQYLDNKCSNSVRERSHSNVKDSRSNRTSTNGAADANIVHQRDAQMHNNVPASPTSTTTTTIILTTNNRLHRLSMGEDSPVQQQQPPHLSSSVPRSQPMMMPPPRWIPDEEAPQCMSCAQSFTTFRRRHHCRNCGGVFCGVCSNSQAPLPKFGLNKAVRVCRNCFMMSITTGNANATNNASTTT